MMPRLTDKQFRVMLDWFMVSDPTPLDEESHDEMLRLLEDEGRARNFSSWVVAYHEFKP